MIRAEMNGLLDERSLASLPKPLLMAQTQPEGLVVLEKLGGAMATAAAVSALGGTVAPAH